MAPLRILLVAESFGAGVYEVTRVLAARLAERGHAVAIAYGERPETPPDVRATVDPRVALLRTPWTSRTPRAQVATARWLRAAVARERPDVVHLHSSFAGIVGATALAGRVPLVHSPHGYSFLRTDVGPLRRRAFQLAERYVSHRCDLVGAVSEAEADLARRMTGARHVVVVPNGIPDLDPEHRVPPPSRTGRPVVAAVGRVGPARRPAAAGRILAALRDVADPAWIGGGEPEEEAALRALGVDVTGWIDHRAAVERLARASACLHWSEWDAHPLAVLEAMAREVPVVASDIPANRELLGAEQVRGSEEDAAALLRTLLTDPDARAAALASQRARAERFTTRGMAEAWERAYSGLIKRLATADT